MNPTLKKLVESASDAGALAKSLKESGLAFVQGKAGGFQFSGSLFGIASESAEFDERHYVLVPLASETSGPGSFAVYAKRVVPSPDRVDASKLETKRVFHVPDEAAVPALEGRLLARAVRENTLPPDSALADGLERFAEEIDQSIERVSGGLIVAGGTVCAFNPVLGLGIALPGLLGVIGGKGMKVGFEKLGERTRLQRRESARRRFEKAARKDAAQARTETVASPLLRALARLLSHSGESYDPFFDESTWADRCETPRHFRIAAEAICAIHAEPTSVSEKRRRPPLPEPAAAWIRHLGELREQWS